MHVFQVILGLAATVSALDIRIHDNADCNGGSWQCLGWNPDTCCSAPLSPQHHSVGFYGVVENWKFEARAYEGQNCQTQIQTRRVLGQNFVCLSAGSGSIGSAGYGFWSRRRQALVNAETCTEDNEVTGQKCLESATVDSLVLADGVTMYTIVGVPSDVVLELVADFVFNGTTAENIPQKFEGYKIRSDKE